MDFARVVQIETVSIWYGVDWYDMYKSNGWEEYYHN